MRIEQLRAVLLSHDYSGQPRLQWVGGWIDTWDAALVEVTTGDGTTGLGEVAQGIMAAEAVPGIVEAIRQYAVGLDISEPDTVGDRLRDMTAFWARGGIASGVIGAIETASWDVAGKIAGKPVHVLMGGPARDRVEVYASGGLGTHPAEVLRWVKAQEDHGFSTVKFRAMGSPEQTVDLLREVVPRLAVGTSFVLDAVQGCSSRPWSIADAVRVGDAAGEMGARWFEEPCRAEDVAGYAEVRRRVSVLTSGVESYSTRGEFERLLEHNGVAIAQPDVSMMGGPTEVRRVAVLAAGHGAKCIPHVWGTAVTQMANLHTAFATANMPLVEWCTIPNPLRDALYVESPDFSTGFVHAPSVVGLGVTLTPDVELAFPFRPGRGHVIA